MHIGSGTDLEHLADVCGAMEKAAKQAGRSIRSVSAGGGLPVPYKADDSYVDLDQYFQAVGRNCASGSRQPSTTR